MKRGDRSAFKFGIIFLFYLHCVSYSNREFIVFAAIGQGKERQSSDKENLVVHFLNIYKFVSDYDFRKL